MPQLCMQIALFKTLAFASCTSAALLGVRQSTPPACSASCFDTGTNNISTGNCAVTDIACLCTSEIYNSALSDCFNAACIDSSDRTTAFRYQAALCAAAGVGSGTASAGSTSSTRSHNDTSNSDIILNIAIVVAPIVSVLVAIALVVAFLCFRRRRRVKMSTEDTPQPLLTSSSLMYSDPHPITDISPPAYQEHPTSDKHIPEPIPYTAHSFVEPQGERNQSPQLQERTYAASPLSASSSPPSSSIASYVRPPAYQSPEPHSLMPEPDAIMPSSIDADRGPNDDETGIFAAKNRDLISYELEVKLRRSGYKPTDDPKEMPIEMWISQYEIGNFEVKRLQEIYDSTMDRERGQ